MNLNSLMKKQHFVGLFVGKNGCGKSSAALSFAEEGPVKVYDFDKRIRGGLWMRNQLTPEQFASVEVIQPDISKGWAEVDKALEIDLIKKRSNSFPYKTVMFDSAATMQKYLVSDSQRLRGLANPKGGKSRGKINFWTPDDYNYCSQGFFQFFYNYAAIIDCNVIVSAWQVDKYGKPSGTPEDDDNPYAPNEVIGQKLVLTEKLSEEVPGYFDEIYVFEKEESSLGGGSVKYTCSFESMLAKTCYTSLKKKKKLDFTNNNFYKLHSALIKDEVEGK